MQDNELYELSDEELEAAFREARGSGVELDDDNDDDSGLHNEPLVPEHEGEELPNLDPDVDPTAVDDDDTDIDDDNPDDLTDVVPGEDDPETEPADKAKPAEEPKPADDKAATEAKPAAEAKPETHTFRANGQEFSFTNEEILKNFPSVFGQAMDYTKKMQAIKPWRKTIDALESANIGQEDINLAIEVLKGTPEAIGEVLKRHKIDAFDLKADEDTPEYTAPSHGRDEHQLAIRDVIQDLSGDPEFNVTRGVLDKDGWDNASWEFLTADPERIRLLHVDVKSGLFQQAQAEMNKLRALDRGRRADYEYYMEAARGIIQQNQQASIAEQQRQLNEQAEAEQARLAQEEAAKRAAVREQGARRAATTAAAAGRRAAAPTAARPKAGGPVDYLSASSEEFEEWYRKAMDGQ